MFEVNVSPKTKQFVNEADANKFITDAQALFGSDVTILKNEIVTTYDANALSAKTVGIMVKRVSEYPAKEVAK